MDQTTSARIAAIALRHLRAGREAAETGRYNSDKQAEAKTALTVAEELLLLIAAPDAPPAIPPQPFCAVDI